MIRQPMHPAGAPRYAALYDPVSLALTAVSAIAGMAGSIMQGKSQAATASYQAAVAQNQAKAANINAGYAIQAGQQREQAARMRTAGLIGAERAGAAAHGVDANTGSMVDIQSDSAMLGELDALTIRNNAAREAYNYKVQGMGAKAEAGLLGYEAEQDLTGGFMKGIGSLIGGASSFSDKWASFGEAGVGAPAANIGPSLGAGTTSLIIP